MVGIAFKIIIIMFKDTIKNLKYLIKYNHLRYRDDISYELYDKEYLFYKEKIGNEGHRYIKFFGNTNSIMSDLKSYKKSHMLFTLLVSSFFFE